jgi:hypothetical protein
MSKIIKLPKTKKDFHEYHILLWNEIYDYIFKSEELIDKDLCCIKNEVVEQLFCKKIQNKLQYYDACFACWWKKVNYNECLLDSNCDYINLYETCLNGLYQQLDHLIDKIYFDSIDFKLHKTEILDLTKQIRDFLIRKDK